VQKCFYQLIDGKQYCRNLIVPRNTIDRIRKTIFDILRRCREKPNTVSNQVPTEPFEPLHIDIAVDGTILYE
jgi:hypothetical protein